MVIFGLQRLLILIFSFLLFFFQFSLGIYSVKSIDSGVEFGSAASRSNTPSPPTINEERSTAASPIAIEINNNHVETIKGNINNNDSNVNNNQINGLTIIHKDEGIDMDETIDFIIDDPIQTIAEVR